MTDFITWVSELMKKQKSNKQRTLRNVISFLSLCIIILIILTGWIVTGFRAEQINQTMQNKMKHVTSSFDESIRNIEDDLTLIVKWQKRGSIDLVESTIEDLNSRFIPLIEDKNYLSAVVLIGKDSLCYRLEQDDNNWIGKKEVASFSEYDSTTAQVLENRLIHESRNKIDTSEEIRWIEITEKGCLCLVASISIKNETGESKTVALIIDKARLEETISIESFEENGILRIISGDLFTRSLEMQDKTSVDLNSVSDTVSGTNDILSRALVASVKQHIESGSAFSFHYNSRLWWGLINNIDLGTVKYQFVGLQAQSTIYEENTKERNFYLMTGLIALLVVITLLLFIIRIYNRDRMSGGKINLHKISNVEELIAHGESDNLEFKSTLRWNLKANKPTRDIELAVLKTVVAFLNTEGGILLVGIADDGSALGIEKDNFPNSDKFLLHFNNMIKAHIGLEYANLIDFYLTDYQDKQILVIQCKESKDPIFLKFEETEDFYIRVGPGSRRLSTKKAIKYINERSKH